MGGYRLSDLWEWDGSTWTQRMPVVSPAAGYGPTPIAYDEARQRLTLFNGVDTWVFLP